MIYRTASDFRRALEDRLTTQARAEHRVDPNRLRLNVAFERFLARLFHDGTKRWVLKGGYALELRYPGRARATRDLDLNVPPPPYSDLLDELQAAAERDLGDHFKFKVSAPTSTGMLAGPPQGGQRFSVEAQLAGRRFATFPLDVGQGDITVRQPDHIQGRIDLTFAGITTPTFPVYPVEDHFAEKLHAYTAPHTIRTRVKDLVDMVLLIDQGLEPSHLLRESIAATFERYARHPLPPALPPPPAEWQETFPPLAREVGLSITNSTEAHAFVAEFLTGLL
jgi:predicted nucleotidyltransferase component of viral defense system